MITVTKNEHNIRAIAHDPTKNIRTAIYVGPDGDYIEQWFNPMFCDRTYIRVRPIDATRDDAWLKQVGEIEDFLEKPAANLRPHSGQEQQLFATLFTLGWRVEELMPYDGPKGRMEWNAWYAKHWYGVETQENFRFWTGNDA